MKTKDKFLAFFLFCISVFIAGFGLGIEFPELNNIKCNVALTILMCAFAFSSIFYMVKKSED